MSTHGAVLGGAGRAFARQSHEFAAASAIVVRVAGGFVVAVGLSVLAGWTFGFDGSP
jgi:hypothetical protein